MNEQYSIITVNGQPKYEHRVVLEKIMGRKLLPWEHTHHKNGIKKDNTPSNLCVLNESDHDRMSPTLFKIGHKDKNPWVQETRAMIVSLRNVGFSFGAIAKMVGLHRGTVQHYLTKDLIREQKRLRRGLAGKVTHQ